MKKVCLNCRGNWDECLGYRCMTWDGVCDCNFCSDDLEKHGYGYSLEEE